MDHEGAGSTKQIKMAEFSSKRQHTQDLMEPRNSKVCPDSLRLSKCPTPTTRNRVNLCTTLQ